MRSFRNIAWLAVFLTAPALAAGTPWQADERLVEQLSAKRPGVRFRESNVPKYELPDILRTADGWPALSPRLWPARRAEIVEDFRKFVYGRAPGKPQELRFELLEEDAAALDDAATLRRVAIHSRQGERLHQFELILFLPNAARRPAPVFLLINNRPRENTDATRATKSDFWPVEEMIARGYGMATFHNAELAPDDVEFFTHGVIGLFEGGTTTRPATLPTRTAPRSSARTTTRSTTATRLAASRPTRPAPDAWGAIGAWAWGASRAMDYLESDSRVDAKKVAVLGHSRGGKTALWAGAQDERFALTISNNSGTAGAALHRRAYGETIRIINRNTHWFNDTYKTYNDRDGELPVDQHMLIAALAPRAVYVTSATEDLSADPRGEFSSLAYASPAYALFGHAAIDPARMPAADEPLIAGPRGYHIRTGGHNLTKYDWLRFADFAGILWPR
jgi:hypothetical protein